MKTPLAVTMTHCHVLEVQYEIFLHDSEADASEFLENLEERFPYMQSEAVPN